MTKSITLTIDGIKVSGVIGTTILDLAREAGVKIPTLCHDPHLQPVGACRICLVEDEKNGRLHAACVTPIAQGMVINTSSPGVLKYRTVVVKLMLASHPDSCLVCEKGNRCKLRQIAADLGIGLVEYYPMPNFTGTQEVNPFILRDLSKCILCGKCIRADHELVVEGAIDYTDRGFEARPATTTDGPLEISECTFCGTCVELCPTGALFEKEKRYRGTTSQRIPTTCSFCGCGCSFWLEVSGNQVVGVRPGISGSVNEGTLCVKGHYGYQFINHLDRLRKPLVKKDDTLVETSWDEAFQAAAQGLEEIKKKSGSTSIAVLAGPHCTNEEAFLLKKFASEVVETEHALCGSGAYVSPLSQGMEETVGYVGTRNSIKDLEEAEAILLVGANPTETAPVVGYSIKRGVRQGHTALIVVDPVEIKLSRYAGLWLRPSVGSDEFLLLAFLRLLLESESFEEITSVRGDKKLKEVREKLGKFSLEDVEKKTGVPLDSLKEAVRLFRSAEKRAIVFGGGVVGQPGGKNLVKLLCTIGSISGLLKKEETMIFPLIKQSNVMGCFHVGLTGKETPETLFKEILRGNIKGLWIMGEDPMLNLPGVKDVEKALKKLEILIVSDSFLTETGKSGHVVFPSATFAEKSGTITNLEGRVQRIRKAVDCVGESRPDWQIIGQVAARLGTPFHYTSERDITEEMIGVVSPYAKMNLPETENGYFSFKSPVSFSKEKTSFFVSGDVPERQKTNEKFPYALVLGSILFQLGCGHQTRHSPKLCKSMKEEYVEINPEDAAKESICDGELVTLISSAGEKKVKAQLTGRVPEGVLFLPLPFVQDTTLLPFNQEGSGFKTCQVKIERVTT
jgi:formate dehydrogenase alpha subunit